MKDAAPKHAFQSLLFPVHGSFPKVETDTRMYQAIQFFETKDDR